MVSPILIFDSSVSFFPTLVSLYSTRSRVRSRTFRPVLRTTSLPRVFCQSSETSPYYSLQVPPRRKPGVESLDLRVVNWYKTLSLFSYTTNWTV